MATVAIPRQGTRTDLARAGTDWRGVVFQALLLLCLLTTLLFLVVLIVEVLIEGVEVGP